MQIPQWTVAFPQRDWKFSISALIQSTAESTDPCGKCESAFSGARDHSIRYTPISDAFVIKKYFFFIIQTIQLWHLLTNSLFHSKKQKAPKMGGWGNEESFSNYTVLYGQRNGQFEPSFIPVPLRRVGPERHHQNLPVRPPQGVSRRYFVHGVSAHFTL